MRSSGELGTRGRARRVQARPWSRRHCARHDQRVSRPASPLILDALARKDTGILADLARDSGAPAPVVTACASCPSSTAMPRLDRGPALLHLPQQLQPCRAARSLGSGHASGLESVLLVDFGEVRGFAYYTGAIFHLLAEGPVSRSVGGVTTTCSRASARRCQPRALPWIWTTFLGRSDPRQRRELEAWSWWLWDLAPRLSVRRCAQGVGAQLPRRRSRGFRQGVGLLPRPATARRQADPLGGLHGGVGPRRPGSDAEVAARLAEKLGSR